MGVRLLDVPADAADNPRAREYIVDNLTPGTTIHRRIAVSNTTRAELHVAIYPAAATISQGSFVGAPAHKADDLSSWTTVSRNATVTLHSGLSQQAFRAKITFPRSPGTAPPAAARPVGGGLSLVTILAGAILIALLAALIALIITHRRRRLS